MNSLALALVLVFGAPPADPVAGPRRAYSACLERFYKAAVEKKMEASAFEAQVATTCSAELNALKAAYVASEVRAGFKRADAERDIGTEVEDYQANLKDRFQSAFASAG